MSSSLALMLRLVGGGGSSSTSTELVNGDQSPQSVRLELVHLFPRALYQSPSSTSLKLAGDELS